MVSSIGAIGAISTALLATQIFSHFPVTYAAVRGRVLVEQNDLKDIKTCSNSLPITQMRTEGNSPRSAAVHDAYVTEVKKIQALYKKGLSSGTFVEDDILVDLPEGNFVFWGNADRAIVEMSAYNQDTVVEGDVLNGGREVHWRYTAPHQKDYSTLKKTTILHGDYVAFVTDKFSIFAHFFLDYMGYVAYLREIVPETTRFLLFDVEGNSEQRLQILDPVFAKRVDWMQCDRFDCNQLVQIRGGTLTVLKPVSATRHIDLLYRLREWMLETHPPKPETLTDRTVVYYTRNADGAKHGRSIDMEQEAILIQKIRESMKRHERPEKLVIFDGTQQLEDQIDLFQSANVVIGAHGGGMANLIFMLPSKTCEERPKVLEFLTNAETPDIQRGALGKTYYNLYSTAPWIEYHHVFLVPPTTEDAMYVDVVEFEKAVDILFGGSDHSSTIKYN